MISLSPNLLYGLQILNQRSFTSVPMRLRSMLTDTILTVAQ